MDIKFLEKALATEFDRPALTVIHAIQDSEGRLWATASDGYRMHMYPITELDLMMFGTTKAGNRFYSISPLGVSSSAEDNGVWNWEEAIDKGNKAFTSLLKAIKTIEENPTYTIRGSALGHKLTSPIWAYVNNVKLICGTDDNLYAASDDILVKIGITLGLLPTEIPQNRHESLAVLHGAYLSQLQGYGIDSLLIGNSIEPVLFYAAESLVAIIMPMNAGSREIQGDHIAQLVLK